jgi:hypothetical protein
MQHRLSPRRPLNAQFNGLQLLPDAPNAHHYRYATPPSRRRIENSRFGWLRKPDLPHPAVARELGLARTPAATGVTIGLIH